MCNPFWVILHGVRKRFGQNHSLACVYLAAEWYLWKRLFFLKLNGLGTLLNSTDHRYMVSFEDSQVYCINLWLLLCQQHLILSIVSFEFGKGESSSFFFSFKIMHKFTSFQCPTLNCVDIPQFIFLVFYGWKVDLSIQISNIHCGPPLANIFKKIQY